MITGTDVPFVHYILNFCSLQGVFCPPLAGPLWSLTYEVWFYILAGAGAAIIVANNNRSRALAFIVLAGAMIILSRLSTIYTFLWFMGALTSQFKQERCNSIYLLIGLVGMFVCALLNLHTITSFLGISPDSIVANAITVMFGCSSCMFIINVVVVTVDSPMGYWFNKVGKSLSKFSYTLYLSHWSVLTLMVYGGVPAFGVVSVKSITVFVTGILMAHIVAYLLYLLFEAHTFKIKSLIKSKLRFYK